MLTELAPQVADVHVERPIFATEFVLEQIRDETLAFNDRAARLHEAGHDLVLHRRQIEWHIVQTDLAAGWMKGDAGDPAHDARRIVAGA